jgi:ribosomal protein S18 acetylase RimI-like enzyme
MKIRLATEADGLAISEVFVAARDRMTYLPRITEPFRSTLGGLFIERHPLWVAEEGRRVVGFVSLDDAHVVHLYVEPPAQNRGIGTTLLGFAKAERPTGLDLWVFQKNDGARRFYERYDFRLVRLTDGADNMEREPDAFYEWTPPR